MCAFSGNAFPSVEHTIKQVNIKTQCTFTKIIPSKQQKRSLFLLEVYSIPKHTPGITLAPPPGQHKGQGQHARGRKRLKRVAYGMRLCMRHDHRKRAAAKHTKKQLRPHYGPCQPDQDRQLRGKGHNARPHFGKVSRVNTGVDLGSDHYTLFIMVTRPDRG